MKKINILILSLLLIGFISCSEEDGTDKDIRNKPTISNIEDDEVEDDVRDTLIIQKTVIQRVYVNNYDSYNPDETQDVSYWYVHYDVHIKKPESRYTGYTVIKLPTKHYDVGLAIREIVPKVTDDDYVGVTFFRRVDFETYMSDTKDD